MLSFGEVGDAFGGTGVVHSIINGTGCDDQAGEMVGRAENVFVSLRFILAFRPPLSRSLSLPLFLSLADRMAFAPPAPLTEREGAEEA